jgi:hypothetical protein
MVLAAFRCTRFTPRSCSCGAEVVFVIILIAILAGGDQSPEARGRASKDLVGGLGAPRTGGPGTGGGWAGRRATCRCEAVHVVVPGLRGNLSAVEADQRFTITIPLYSCSFKSRSLTIGLRRDVARPSGWAQVIGSTPTLSAPQGGCSVADRSVSPGDDRFDTADRAGGVPYCPTSRTSRGCRSRWFIVLIHSARSVALRYAAARSRAHGAGRTQVVRSGFGEGRRSCAVAGVRWWPIPTSCHSPRGRRRW